jgi:hypothetical protein
MIHRTLRLLLVALALQACGGSAGSGAAPGAATPTFVSAPDCPGPQNIIAEESAAPPDATFMRVQHIGDPGSAELSGEVANRVTWSVGDVTGFYPPDPLANFNQRGYRDLGPPTMASAFQLACDGAGFLINTFEFSHHAPLVGEGPSASLARDPSARPQVFRDERSALEIEADIDLRHVAYQTPHDGDGTAQLSFFYYIQDATTGVVFAHVIGLFDSRAPGIGGSLVEALADDTHVAFIFSPLLPVDGAGAPVRHVRLGAASARARSQVAWQERTHFAARIPYDVFAATLARLKAGPLPAISPRPEDYRLTEFGVLGEVFPGTGEAHNVAIGASVFDLRLTGG